MVANLLSAQSAERSAVVDLLRLQARGDERALVAGIDACASDPACVTAARRHALRLRGEGKLEVVRVDHPSRYSLMSRTATLRVVWKLGDSLTTVQCARVRRAGSLVEGFEISVLSLSDPIGRESGCGSGA